MNNQTLFKGNLAKSVEIKKGNEDKEFAVFTVATNRSKDAKPDFLDFICFDQRSVEWMKDHGKGHPVFVEGYVRKYKDKEGAYKTQLVATYARPFERSARDESDDLDNASEHMDDPELDQDEISEF